MSKRSKNTDPNSRLSNTQLIWLGILQFTLIAVIGVFAFPLVYVVLTGQRETILTALVSAVIAVTLFSPFYFRHAIVQKKQYIASGGDASGMNLWMFGAMGTDWKNRESSF